MCLLERDFLFWGRYAYDAFVHRFGRPKPSSIDTIVIFSQTGNFSRKAQLIMAKRGFRE